MIWFFIETFLCFLKFFGELLHKNSDVSSRTRWRRVTTKFATTPSVILSWSDDRRNDRESSAASYYSTRKKSIRVREEESHDTRVAPRRRTLLLPQAQTLITSISASRTWISRSRVLIWCHSQHPGVDRDTHYRRTSATQLWDWSEEESKVVENVEDVIDMELCASLAEIVAKSES